MGYGDELLAAAEAAQLYGRDPSRRVSIVDVSGHPRWHDIWDGNPILARPDDVAQGEDVQFLMNAPFARPYIVHLTEQDGWTFNLAFHARDYIPKIYLTEAECNRGRDARARYGPYVLVEPYTKHTNLRWPFEYWCALVASRPDLTWVQHTHAASTNKLIPGVHYEQATFREACGLVAAARVYVRSESGMVHAAHAFNVPSVTIWGGCIPWTVLGDHPKQIGVGIDTGPGSPCGRWLPCDHCHQILAGITPAAVSEAITDALS